MFTHARVIKVYWLHILMLLIGLLTLVEGYYGMFLIYNKVMPAEIHPISKWDFLLTRVLPISMLYLTIMQLFPNTYEVKEKFQFKQLIHEREDKILILLFFSLLAIVVRNWLVMFKDIEFEKLLYRSDFNFLVGSLVVFAGVIMVVYFVRKLRLLLPFLFISMLLYIVALMSDLHPYCHN